MARKVNKLQPVENDFFDLAAASGITFDRIGIIKTNGLKDVKQTLCKYRGFVRVLRTEKQVNKYISQCLKNGIVAVDTETDNKLDPHEAVMVGLCLYTPYNHPAYIPVRHRDKLSGQLLEGQVTKEFMKKPFEKLASIKCVFHNAKFDVNVIRNNYGVVLPIYWDTYIAAKVLDENRRENGLKSLYVEGIEPTQTSYHVTTFFDDNEHADIEDFALYSAIDSYDTYKVYQWQNKELSSKSMGKLRSLLLDLEFPVTQVCADMEDNGVEFNEKYCQNYIKTETQKLNDLEGEIHKLLEPYKESILSWKDVPGGRGLVVKKDPETGLPVKKKKRVEKNIGIKTIYKWVDSDEDEMVPDPYAGVDLGWPILLTSPQKVLCLLNCILGLDVNSTVVDDLKATQNNIAILIGKYRHLSHNLSSFFIPYAELEKRGRMYATFNQMGGEDKKSEEAKKGKGPASGDSKDTVVTGRFSCKSPNLEQLPARQGEDGVRMMFGGSRDVPFDLDVEGDSFSVFIKDKVETTSGFIPAEDLKGNEIIATDEGLYHYIIKGRNGEMVDMVLTDKAS